MRSVILFLFLWISVSVFGQKTSSDKLIDISAIGNLVAKKPTVAEVLQTLGEPTEQSLTPERTLLQYEKGEDLYVLRFEKDKKLHSLVFEDQSKNQIDKLAYETVKHAREVKTKQDVRTKLGQPTQISADGEVETWYYIFEEKQIEKALIVRFGLSNPGLVQSYSFTVDFKKETTVSSTVINDLVVGLSTYQDVESKLGKPSQILLDNEQEKWYYTSQNSDLVVYFNKQSKVDNYFYEKSSK